MCSRGWWSSVLLWGTAGILLVACQASGTSTPGAGGNPTGGSGSATDSSVDRAAGSGPGARTVLLRAQNNSGISGSATLTDMGGQTQVQITITGSNEVHPAHIYEGTCDNLNPSPRYPLANVQGGLSSTIVPASIQELTDGDKALNLHRSPTDLPTYVACGNLP